MARKGAIVVDLKEYRRSRAKAETKTKGRLSSQPPFVPRLTPMMWFPMFAIVPMPVMTMVPYFPSGGMGWKSV